MPRPGISFDKVAAVAYSMMAEGLSPTILSVRERLRTGSSNTIQRHLAAWRDAMPQFNAATIELPASITTAISQEIGRARSEAKAEIEARLVIVQAESAELAASGEKLEAELEELHEGLTVITTDRDMLRGKLQEQAVEIGRLAKENERERYGAEQARTEVAQIRNKIGMQAEKLLEQSATIDQLTSKNSAESQARISAEKDAAVLTVKLESDHEKQTFLLSEKETLIALVDAERQAAEAARIESAKRARDLELQSAALTEKVSDVKKLTGLYEAEKNALIDAEKQIAALSQQCKKYKARPFQRHNQSSSKNRTPS